MAKILILEDTIDVVATMKGMLEDEGHQVSAEGDPSRALEKIRRFEPDLVTLDISFSEQRDETGIELLREIRAEFTKDRLPILVISGTADAEKLTRMMAWDINGYLGKPVKQADLQKKITDALETKTAAPIQAGVWEARMIGGSSVILELIPEIGKAAKAESDLLVTGESGAGKEQVVRKYRELSPRQYKPFVLVNCTTINHSTFEAEIFGHEKGAFTGAGERKKGRIEAAAGGIVFFDEIGDLPADQQPKLLRLLQEKTFTRMSSNEEIKLDVVVLAATNRNLYQMMKQGTLRKDLYYRLNYMKIEMPPLRDHLEDIPQLAEHFIRKANWKYRKAVAGADAEVIQRFLKMKWDGNVRQLEKCVENGVISCEGRTLKWRDVAGFFREEMSAGENVEPARVEYADLKYREFGRFLKTDRQEKEKKYYLNHLRRNGFNVRKTAVELGVARSYLNAIMKRLKISKNE